MFTFPGKVLYLNAQQKWKEVLSLSLAPSATPWLSFSLAPSTPAKLDKFSKSTLSEFKYSPSYVSSYFSSVSQSSAADYHSNKMSSPSAEGERNTHSTPSPKEIKIVQFRHPFCGRWVTSQVQGISKLASMLKKGR